MGGCFGHATKRVNCSKKHDGLFMTTYCKNAGEKKKEKKGCEADWNGKCG